MGLFQDFWGFSVFPLNFFFFYVQLENAHKNRWMETHLVFSPNRSDICRYVYMLFNVLQLISCETYKCMVTVSRLELLFYVFFVRGPDLGLF